MAAKRKAMRVSAVVFLAVAGSATAFSAMIPAPAEISAPPTAATANEYSRTIAAMKPPKRARPIIAVLGDNRGTEAIDFLVPYGVLRRSGVADVIAVGMTGKRLQLRPALAVAPQSTAADFDARYPGGADYVVVPAMTDHQDPAIHDWIRSQATRGATIVAICAGAEILANAGLLRNRAATTHWASVRKIMAADRTIRWVPHRRYVADRGVVTTTGVSAAMPVSVALVEAIAGRDRAAALARELGVSEWGLSHDSSGYSLGRSTATVLGNSAAKWNHEKLGIPVRDGVDEIGLSLAADSWSRTFRSHALTLATPAKVRTRGGLELIVDRHGKAGLDRILAPVEERHPGGTLDRSFAQIASTYGKATARLVAVQLEYPKGL